MEPVLTGAASNAISSVATLAITPLIVMIDDLIRMDQNTQLLQEKLTSTKILLQDISNQFQHYQGSPPGTVTYWSQQLQQSLRNAQNVIHRSQQQKWCLDCFVCKPRLARQIREWTTNFDEQLNNLQRGFQVVRDAQQLASPVPQRPETLLQPVPGLGFVGSGIEDAEKMVQTWLNVEDHQFRVIGIYGIGGIGKTSLLKRVYNTHRKGNVFQAVIWITVSEKINILNMQKVIADKNNLNLPISSNSESSSDAEMLKMRIFPVLKEMKYLLILDDMWNSLDLEEVGIPVGNNNKKGSRVIISTRSTQVVTTMEANEYSIQIKPLSEEEGWELFCRKAFGDGGAPTKSIEDVARQIAGECKGLPLAINVVAAATKGNATVNEWNFALRQIKNVDPDFLNYSGIDKNLFHRLKWSYDALPDNYFQNCFLYCGAFPDDAEIEVETLLEMWIGEGLVPASRGTSYLMDTGREYVKLLVERCLFEDVHGNMGMIKVHDVLRDMAIHIAEKEENCLFRTAQYLQQFSVENGMENAKRIAIGYNEIPSLPPDLRCPNLLALLLDHNKSLTQIPDDFFLNLASLRVLDMSGTKIESLPKSMWHLTQLEFLGLGGTSIKELPEGICKLGRLQFLHLEDCRELKSLPSTIGELKNLKHLDLQECRSLTEIPCEISQLTSLNILRLRTILNVEEGSSGGCSLRDLANLTNLMELRVGVKAGGAVDGMKSGIKVGIMGTWLDMKHLTLYFPWDGTDDVMEDLPQDMHHMKKLQSFSLYLYCGTSLPICICNFEQLERLELGNCYQVRELPPLERLPNLKQLKISNCYKLKELGIGSGGSAVGFPMLEVLGLNELPMLESMRSSSSNIVWSEGWMPKLHYLFIYGCPSLKRLPKEIIQLPTLREIQILRRKGEEWAESLIWEDENDKKMFKDKVKYWN